jgi:hypothetical protein
VLACELQDNINVDSVGTILPEKRRPSVSDPWKPLENMQRTVIVREAELGRKRRFVEQIEMNLTEMDLGV